MTHTQQTSTSLSLLPHSDAVHMPPPPLPFAAIDGPALPPYGYSVAVLADGDHYPQRLEEGAERARFMLHVSPLIEAPETVKFRSYSDAIDYCWEEVFAEVEYENAIERVMHWQDTFAYSDRVTECQQFLEEVTGEKAQFWSSNGCAIASVGPFLWSPRPFFLTAWKETIEEALVDLCDQVDALARSVLEQTEDEEWVAWWEAEK